MIWTKRSALLSLTLSLAVLAGARAKDCGPLPTGKNPSPEELSAEIARCSAIQGVPTEIIKAIAWQESGCQQWRPDGSFVHNTTDCGLGMMQLTGATAEQFDVERLKSDWRYNLEAGVTVLKQKWERAQRAGQVVADPEAKRVLENWYYAVAYYYGAKDEAYLTKIFAHLKNRPGRLAQILAQPVELTLPGTVIAGFKFGDKFRAWPDGRFEDAQGKAYKAPTHPGTIGDPATLARLDAGLARGKKAVEKGKTREAMRWLDTVVEAGYDTPHKAEAEQLMAELIKAGEEKLAEAARLAVAGEKSAATKLARELVRDYEGHPLADRGRLVLDDLKKRD